MLIDQAEQFAMVQLGGEQEIQCTEHLAVIAKGVCGDVAQEKKGLNVQQINCQQAS